MGPETPLPITATIITLNEAENIGDCIASVRAVCDEIVVIDSGSSDTTIQIAHNEGARVIEQAYLGDGPQKALGAVHAANDWILSIDADERLEADALDVIRSIDLQNIHNIYAFKRRNFVGTHWIKAAGFYPDYVPRLYNRQTSGYARKQAHSRVVGSQIVQLPAHMRHYTYRDYSHWLERINQLSTRDAWAKHNEGKSATPVDAIFRAIFAFVKKLFLKRGIVQGSDGWLVAFTTAFHVYMKYLKLAELSSNRNDQHQP